ncbi:glycoside hydrolase family 5 protein [Jaapia argillacea MUCL 33604]|uniref:mannan endo-1,4-beta-mannosidase n=1 Tax=Jaapia argillacea MUCL 33604 TaxID=933084 RepID=A0A067PDK8_9AGAM|nr:glycoside hydrolase family 5 protein [Jaapia argillacea MUCL 33604]
MIISLTRCLAFVSLWCAVAASNIPSRTVTERGGEPQFVQAHPNGKFAVNGKELEFVGTNAYWLPTLNTEADIEHAFKNFSARGIRVVRTWFFNDVTTIPQNSNWLQLIEKGGKTTLNTGPNGLQKLDLVVTWAEKTGVYLIPSLTNNWNPLPPNGSPSRRYSGEVEKRWSNVTRPRNYLSNDYGGIDVYVRQFECSGTHDAFYTDQNIIASYKAYVAAIVGRYKNSPAIFGWEIANDARCFSSVGASGSCTTQTITNWFSILAKHIRAIDCNHLITAGTGGFYCLGCPKLFPHSCAPAPSPAPGAPKARAVSKAQIVRERIDELKKTREEKIRSGELPRDGVKVRGRWAATEAQKRGSDSTTGSAFDGSFGVDSEDILNIPEISFGSFQLFPDQDEYGCPDPHLSRFNNSLQLGLSWIQKQGATGKCFGKPMALGAFGLVTQHNAPFFVPFNSTIAPFSSHTHGKQHTTLSAGLLIHPFASFP